MFSCAADSEDVYKGYIALLSMYMAPLVFSIWIYFIGFHEMIGVLVLSIKEMLFDVVNFLVLFLMVTITFTFIFLGLEQSGLYESPQLDTGPPTSTRQYDSEGALLVAFWAAFGEFITLPQTVNIGVNMFVSIVLIVYALFSNVRPPRDRVPQVRVCVQVCARIRVAAAAPR